MSDNLIEQPSIEIPSSQSNREPPNQPELLPYNGNIHGHDILLKWLARQPKRLLVNKTLLEVGSIREELENGNSTPLLAKFCQENHMHFITVDMNPDNTRTAQKILQTINPTFQAINDQAENFTQHYKGPIDYVYMDAFDLNHSFHTPQRRQAYRDHLQCDITAEACWKMHYDTAINLLTNHRNVSLFCFDDTWENQEGEYRGKGRTAIPLLQSVGYQKTTTGGVITLTRPT